MDGGAPPSRPLPSAAGAAAIINGGIPGGGAESAAAASRRLLGAPSPVVQLRVAHVYGSAACVSLPRLRLTTTWAKITSLKQ